MGLDGFRLIEGQPVRVRYRVLKDPSGSVRSLLRIVWSDQGHEMDWMFGDGFFAHEGTGWLWCPEDFRTTRGMAWKISGMGGADDDSEDISRAAALAMLAAHGVEPDSIDHGIHPTREEQEEFQERRRGWTGQARTTDS